MSIPKGWRLGSIESISDTIYRYPTFYGMERHPVGVAVINGEHLRDRSIIVQDASCFWYVNPALSAQYPKTILEAGDIAMSVRGTIGTYSRVSGIHVGSQISPNLIRVSPNASEVHAVFMFYAIDTPISRLVRVAAQSQALPALAAKDLKKAMLLLPPLAEQEKIAEILGEADGVIAALDERIAAAEQRKNGLAQRLLSGELRFPEFRDEPWEEVRLGDVFTRIEDKVADDPDPPMVLSITAKVGFVSQADKFSRVIAGDSLGKYVCLKRGDFSYNKGNSKTYPMGAIFRLHEFDRGCVPNVFFSFRTSSKRVVPEFYEHYFAAGKLNRQLRRLINSGVRNDGLLNLKAEEFFDVMIDLPGPDEQRKVAACLSAAANEIELLRQQREAFNQLKRGLMQVLLTGKVRVKVDGEGK